MSIPYDADADADVAVSRGDGGIFSVDEDSPTDWTLDPAPGYESLFASELDTLHASDWDVDSTLIWGDDGVGTDDGGAPIAFDIPL